MDKLHISPGNTKLGNIPSVSLDPNITCRSDWPCWEKCYARRLARFRPNVKKCWENNTELYMSDPMRFEAQLNAYLSLEEPRYFRFHVGGEVRDQDHADMITRVSNKHPDTWFMLFSRRDDLDWSSAPANLNILFSYWSEFQDRVPNVQQFRMTIIAKEEPATGPHYTCPGSCITCKFCYKDRGNRSMWSNRY